jgi:hypothetical protein
METTVQLDPAAQKLFIFDEVYTAPASQEQADRKKLDAFGKLHRFNPVNRPKPGTVSLNKWERRYEPFWYVSARREVDYIHEAVYQVAVSNSHTLKINIEGRDYDVSHAGGKPHIDLPLREICHRKIDVSLYQNGVKRDIKSSVFQNYIGKYKATEKEELDCPEAVINQMPLAAVIQIVKSKLATETIEAHQVTIDKIVFDKVFLYYRPVYAFEFTWATSSANSKAGVIEIDALTGDVIEEGEWLKEKVGRVATKENLFEIGVDVVSSVSPPAGIAIKIIGKIMEQKK